MKSELVLLILLSVSASVRMQQRYPEDVQDNEFAEFEDFEEEEEAPEENNKMYPETEGKAKRSREAGEGTESAASRQEDDETVVEDEDNDFDHFHDEEEFEGFESSQVKPEEKDAPKITITKVPLHLRTNWDSYYLEMLMMTGLLVYFLNFFTGKSKNHRLANMWFHTHKSLLEENFSLVGDDGKIELENPGLMKESENVYTLWCSGRTCCEGMLVELKFLKRQDLLAVMTQMVRPGTDQVHIRVDMNKEDMDSFVFCVASKKSAAKLSRDMADLSVYCPEKKSGEKLGIPSNFSIMSEIGEVASAMLDSRTVTVLNKYSDLVDYIHFSDRYSGVKQPEDSNATKLPDVKKVLIFHFNIPMKGHGSQEAMDQMKPLLQLVFYSMEKVKRYRLSKEGKARADKNRLRIEEAFLKSTHAARAEAAAARREEKKRLEKERILQEDDPEKQRKWEEKEMKRQLKRKAPKMKQLKVKAL